MIRHHLKDGRVLDDITGHVVRKEDVPLAYQLMEQMNNERARKRKFNDGENRVDEMFSMGSNENS